MMQRHKQASIIAQLCLALLYRMQKVEHIILPPMLIRACLWFVDLPTLLEEQTDQ